MVGQHQNLGHDLGMKGDQHIPVSHIDYLHTLPQHQGAANWPGAAGPMDRPHPSPRTCRRRVRAPGAGRSDGQIKL
jgi:hypothetical protein